MRIVNDDDAAAFTCQRAANGCCQPVAALIVVKPGLGVLVSRDADAIAPVLLIPWAFNEAAGLDAIADGQVLGV